MVAAFGGVPWQVTFFVLLIFIHLTTLLDNHGSDSWGLEDAYIPVLVFPTLASSTYINLSMA